MINQVIQGNVLEILPQIPSSFVTLAPIDPPFGIGYQNKDWDKFESQEEFLKFSEKWIKEVFRILKDNGTLYCFMAWQNAAEIKLILDNYGTIRNWITWTRLKGRGTKKNYKSMKEEVFYYTKTDKFIWNPQQILKKHVFPYVKDGKPRGWFLDADGNKVRWTGVGNSWSYTPPFWKMKEWYGHPSQKPELMYERMILASSNEGDTILDIFSGSGTASVVAKKLNRNFICVENDPYWVDVIKRRLSEIK